MSVNGLESSDVNGALSQVLQSDGAWLILEYQSRDEVALHRRGSGGLEEIRTAFADYAHKSPLYGLLAYRDAKILVKYIPEGTSRLLQARTNVHLHAVKEKLSPHDHVHSATSPDDLTESTLAEVCGLQAAEPWTINPRKEVETKSDDAPETPKRQKDEETVTPKSYTFNPRLDSASRQRTRDGSLNVDDDDLDSILLENRKPKKPRNDTMELTAFLKTVSPPRSRPSSPSRITSVEERSATSPSDFRSRPSEDPHKNSISSAAGSDFFRFFKPKVKLHPRPATEESMKNSAAAVGGGFRQRLPTGMRSRAKEDGERPLTSKSQKNHIGPEAAAQRAQSYSPNSYRYESRQKDQTSPSQKKNRSSERRGDTSKPVPPLPREALEASSVSSNHRDAPSPLTPRSKVDARYDGESMVSDLTMSKENIAPPTEPPKTPVEDPMERDGEQTETEESAKRGRFRDPIPSVLPPEKQRLMKALRLRKEQRLEEERREKEKEEQEERERQSNVSPGQDEPMSIDTFQSRSNVDDPALPLSSADSGVAIGPYRSRPAQPTAQQSPPRNQTSSAIAKSRPHPLRSHPSHIMASKDEPNSSTLQVSDYGRDTPDGTDSRRARSPIEYLDVDRMEAGSSSVDENEATPVAKVRARAKRKAKRRGIVEPFEVPTEDDSATASQSASRSLSIVTGAKSASHKSISSEGLLAELENSRVEEAQQINVPQSMRDPISPVLTRDRTLSEAAFSVNSITIQRRTTRDFSGRNSVELPGVARQPSVKTTTHTNDNRPSSRKGPTSLGMAKRIQALAERNRAGVNERSDYFTHDPVHTYSDAETPQSKSMSRQQSFTKSPTAVPSRPSSPTKPGSRRRPSMQTDDAQSRPGSRRRDANRVSVLIDQPVSRSSPYGYPFDEQDMGLFTPPILEDHVYDFARSPSRISFSRSEVPHSGMSASSRPVSRDSVRTSMTRHSADNAWRSMRRPEPRFRTGTAISNGELERVDELSEKESTSRASKLFKRMSAMRKGGADAKNGKESSSVAAQKRGLLGRQVPATGLVIGDLNVQFPDTLLWKRRWVEVDPFGNLVLSPVKASERARGGRKKFHLSEFHPPIMPPKDHAEMAHSVVLDFLDGGTLQLACEDPVGQSQIYRRLYDIHGALMDSVR